MDIQYKIIGGDGAEYGPAPLAELKSWIRDGRVAAMTKVWRSDLSIWTPADRYTELHEDLAQLHAAASAAANRAQPPAGFWARLAARIIDQVVIALIFFTVWGPIAEAQHWKMPEPPQLSANTTAQQFQEDFTKWMNESASMIFPVFCPIFLLYEMLLNGRFGATVGKMAIGAKITLIDGSPIGYGRAALRWFAERITDVLFFGYILIAFRQDKRGLHDFMAGTKVVFKR
jgi:uncharacterized RDD family membrane protein YckC